MYLGNQINRDRQTHMALYTLFRTEFNNHTLCPAAYLHIGHRFVVYFLFEPSSSSSSSSSSAEKKTRDIYGLLKKRR